MLQRIGESINDAIDWTQDKLETTRPLAEQTLFAMITDGMVTETSHGFILFEGEDDDKKMKKTLSHIKAHTRPRSRSHHHPHMHKRMKHIKRMQKFRDMLSERREMTPEEQELFEKIKHDLQDHD